MIWPQLIMWVVSFLLTDYFRERLPSQTPSGIGDFNIPTATEGRAVPIITGGTVRCDAPNCIWYGDFTAVERTVTTGIVFKREEVIGYTYELAMQYALFKGESVGITGIWIGDERVFDHVADAGGIPQDFVDVNRDDLFGGPDQGGGFQGRIRLHKGSETQPVSTFLASRMSPLPAYRGLSYIVISNIQTQVLNGWIIENVTAETKGANFGESNQIRYVRVEVQTFDDLAGTAGSPALGDTMNLGNDHHFIGPDLNPIVVAWDLWTNTRWGRGFGLGDVNLANFKAAAETCWSEGIGWTNLIDEQTTTGAIQDMIEQHIDGYIGPNPLTGQIEVSLARPDYVVASLPLVDDNNLIEVKDWAQGDWSNTKNRVRIRYTSRTKDWKETHAVETAAGNRVIQGRTVTEEIRYEGVHTDAVAQVIAARDKRGLSIPLQKGTIVVDRTGYQFKPGQPFRLTSSQTKTTDLPVRVTRIAYGDSIRQSIELSVVEDIFGNEPATVETNPPSDFVPPIQAVIPFDALSQAALEPSFHLMQYDTLPGVTGRVATMARRNAGNRPTEYATLQRNAAGVPAGAYTSLTPNITAGFSAVGTLRNAELGGQAGNGTFTIQIDPFTGESLDALIGVYDPRFDDPRGVAIISPGLADEEFIIFSGVVDDGAGIQLQGVYRSASDTPWTAHAAGAGVWFIWTGGFGMNEDQTYALARNVEIKLLPISPNSQVLEAAATALPLVKMDTATGNRTTKPLLPVELEIPAGSPWPAVVDFETNITPQSGPNYIGSQVVPLHRLASNPDIQNSVKGFTLAGIPAVTADFADQALRVTWRLYNLDRDPVPVDSNAIVFGVDEPVVNPDTEIQIEKVDLVAGGAEGFSFNARLEIETKDSRPSSPANNVSHKRLAHDFTALGIFSVPADSAVFQSHFDGANLATVAQEVSTGLREIIFDGGTTAISTTQSVFGGASLLLDNTAGIRTAARRGFDMRGDWTIEARIWFTSEATFPMIFEQWDNTLERGIQIYYQPVNNTFSFNYSTTGVNVVTSVLHTGTFIPTLSTWYAVAFVKKGTTFSTYIDGVQLGASINNTGVYHRSSTDFIFGGGGDAANFFDGFFDEIRITPAALYSANYTISTVAFQDGRSAYPLLSHFDGTLNDVVYPSDDPNHFQIQIGGTSEIDTAQSMFGGASMRSDGVGNLTPALCDGAFLPETVGRQDAAFDFKFGDFTIECFFRFAVAPVGMYLVAKNSRSTGGRNDWSWSISSATQLAFSRATEPASQWANQFTWFATVPAMTTGVWYHAAMVREGNDLSFYFQGNRVSNLVDNFVAHPRMYNSDQPGTLASGVPVTIGRIYGTTSGAAALAPFNGWIDEVNIEKRAIYSGPTYTIPVAPRPTPNDSLTAPIQPDYALLWLADGPSDGYATDRTIRTDDLAGKWIQFEGSSQIDNQAPGALGPGNFSVQFFQNGGVSFSRSEGALYMNGDDFTIEARVRFNSNPSSGGGMNVISQWFTTPNARGFHFTVKTNAGPPYSLEFHWSTDGINDKRVFTAFTPALSTWYHLAVVRSGTSVFLFVDGVLQTNDGASDAITTDVIFNAARQIVIGHLNETPNFHYWNGNIQNIAWTRAAKWTSGFTPPTVLYTPPTVPNLF